MNAARARGKDTVDAFVVRPRQDIVPGELARRIDSLFANAATPTRTQSERQFLEAFLRQYADVRLIVNLVVGAAFITLLMIVVNTMVFAVRERVFEIGVLKTLGVSHFGTTMLVLGETLFIFSIGGGLGLALAKLATMYTGPELGLVFSPAVFGKALAIMLGFGLATGVLTALNVMRTTSPKLSERGSPMSIHSRQAFIMIRTSLSGIPRRSAISASMALSVALVVCVLAGFLSIAKGFETALDSTGSPSVAVILGEGNNQETGSDIPAAVIHTLDAMTGDIGVSRDRDGGLLSSREIIVLIDVKQTANGTVFRHSSEHGSKQSCLPVSAFSLASQSHG